MENSEQEERELRNRIDMGLEKTATPDWAASQPSEPKQTSLMERLVEVTELYEIHKRKLYALLNDAKEMRLCQRLYFKSRSYSDLDNAKKAERKLDNLIQEMDLASGAVPELDFDNNTNRP